MKWPGTNTERSSANAFSWQGAPSCFLLDQQNKNKYDHGAAVSATMQRKRDTGKKVAEVPMVHKPRKSTFAKNKPGPKKAPLSIELPGSNPPARRAA